MTQWKFHNALTFFRLFKVRQRTKKQLALFLGHYIES